MSRRLPFLLPVLCLCAGCTSSSTPDYSDGTYAGTLSRTALSCEPPSPQATTGTFVVTRSGGGNLIDVQLPGASACQLVAPGADDLLDSVDDPPAGCAERPAGFAFSMGFFDYGDTPAELTLSWSQGGCTVSDAWSLTR